ncbi:hypothetical protein TWF481_005695 [Arthrobotrys musiformis]|uniref:Uncharacterized protein n=1 Tax=Arthrobotrys musiformis TaxID=47236 RepID=A0AAV9WFN9_9PEZI
MVYNKALLWCIESCPKLQSLALELRDKDSGTLWGSRVPYGDPSLECEKLALIRTLRKLSVPWPGASSGKRYKRRQLSNLIRSLVGAGLDLEEVMFGRIPPWKCIYDDEVHLRGRISVVKEETVRARIWWRRLHRVRSREEPCLEEEEDIYNGSDVDSGDDMYENPPPGAIVYPLWVLLNSRKERIPSI